MNQERPTPTIEDYLGVMYTLERDGESIISSRLAKWIEVSPPTVTATIKRMIRDGWVTMDQDKQIHLTPAGREAAKSVLRRHMLSEVLLNRVLGVPWSQTHHEAHQMEHTISPETMARMVETLDDPLTCPHGNPLPGNEELLSQWVPLTELQAGQEIMIQRVHESAEENLDLLAFLESKGILPGTEAILTEIMPFNQTIALQIGDQRVVLGLAVAEQIYAEVISSPDQ
jgi:DtxR family Mn-dependent transcriptional regulator